MLVPIPSNMAANPINSANISTANSETTQPNAQKVASRQEVIDFFLNVLERQEWLSDEVILSIPH